MVVKMLIFSVVIVALVMLVLGIKLLLDPKAEFTVHSCALEDGIPDEDGTCFKCQLKDLANCPEKDNNKLKNKQSNK